jgi:hypothetical protein
MFANCVCSNPACNVTFCRPGEGRIFFFPANSESRFTAASVTDESDWIGHWLCSRCAGRMTVVMTGSGIQVRLRRFVQDEALPSYGADEYCNLLQTPALH